MEEERREGKTSITSISLLSAIQSKVEEQASGHMFVETDVGGKKLQVMVDTGADNVHMVKELADKISTPYEKENAMGRELMCDNLTLTHIYLFKSYLFI